MTSNTASLVLAAMTDRRIASIVARLPAEPRRGRPWSRPLRQRVLIACAALRTDLTMREIGACFGVSNANPGWSTERCNAQILIRRRDPPDRRDDCRPARQPQRSAPLPWLAVEALCREHARVLADGGYRGIGELVTPRFRRNRIVSDRAWRHHRRRRAHWRILRDRRRRGCHLADTVNAVTFLHNLQLDELRDSS
jgi:hypothetical protein